MHFTLYLLLWPDIFLELLLVTLDDLQDNKEELVKTPGYPDGLTWLLFFRVV
jgi:hypothetical protein